MKQKICRYCAVLSSPSDWETISAFYLPVTLLLLVNLYFYLTAQRRIARQIAYNRSMQHFQVKSVIWHN